jgi:EF hand
MEREHKMKMKTKMKATLAALALGASALAAPAQDTDTNAPPVRPGFGGHRPPPPAIIGALDVNHDGVIDSNEIANASAELKTLDKNGDGQLTPDEFIGPRRPGGMDHSGEQNPPDGAPPGPPPNQ